MQSHDFGAKFFFRGNIGNKFHSANGSSDTRVPHMIHRRSMNLLAIQIAHTHTHTYILCRGGSKTHIKDLKNFPELKNLSFILFHAASWLA